MSAVREQHYGETFKGCTITVEPGDRFTRCEIIDCDIEGEGPAVFEDCQFRAVAKPITMRANGVTIQNSAAHVLLRLAQPLTVPK